MAMPYRFALAALLAIAALDRTAPAAADGTYTLQFENDRIAETDRHYTNGMRLSWVSNSKSPSASPQWARDVLGWIYRQVDEELEGRIGLALGQSIFTPEDTAARRLVVDDRPYAGWLYGGISAHTQRPGAVAGIGLEMLDTVELDVGVVGPLALGEEVQNNFHDLIGVGRSNGWDHQLENEPGVMFVFERRWRPNAENLGAVEADLIPHAGVSFGNIMTLANAGATLRIGEGLEVDYGPPHVRPTLSGLAALDGRTDFAWYLFAGAEGRLVARNIFLDGNTVASSHSVDKRPLVADIQIGAAFIYRDTRLAFTHIFRTREFDAQRRADRFGAVSLSVNF